jgi:hypothetical protein
MVSFSFFLLSTLHKVYTSKKIGGFSKAGCPILPRFLGAGRVGPPFESPQRRLPHPFAFFAKGWETTIVCVIGIPRVSQTNTRFLDCADRFTIRYARNDRSIMETGVA